MTKTKDPTRIPEGLQDQAVPIDSVRHHPQNVRKGDLEVIKDSLQVHGQYRTIVVAKDLDPGTGDPVADYCLAGNHTLQAARDLGWTQIASGYVTVDAEEALRILTIDNRANDLADYDHKGLSEVLALLQGTDSGFAGTGFDDQSFEDLKRITGELGDQAAGFLDDYVGGGQPNTANRRGGGDREYVQVGPYPVTPDQRDLVQKALHKIRDERDLQTSVEALVAIAQDILGERATDDA